MAKKKNVPSSAWVDPDDAPELTDEWFAGADLYRGTRLVRRGRPKSASRKQAVSLRLDRDVLAHYRSEGPGWQSRINETLRKAARLKVGA